MKSFYSPTKGRLTFNQLITDLVEFMRADDRRSYSVIIGTDSRLHPDGKTEFVSVILVHRVGKGGRYFWHKISGKKNFVVLRSRIYEEARLSLDLAESLIACLRKIQADQPELRFNFEIHVDVGKKGPTKEMIREIVGMIAGNGFAARIKPDAYVASSVADRHT